MGFTYKIVYVSGLDRFNGLPFPYTGIAVPAEHRPYFTNHERWSMTFRTILFGEELPIADIIPVKDVIDRIHSYDEIVEELVEANMQMYWTRDKHTQFVNAFKFFAANEFYISYC
jgi:hypothetical protein